MGCYIKNFHDKLKHTKQTSPNSRIHINGHQYTGPSSKWWSFVLIPASFQSILSSKYYSVLSGYQQQLTICLLYESKPEQIFWAIFSTAFKFCTLSSVKQSLNLISAITVHLAQPSNRDVYLVYHLTKTNQRVCGEQLHRFLPLTAYLGYETAIQDKDIARIRRPMDILLQQDRSTNRPTEY